MIQVEDLTRRYGEFTAVDRVSFSVNQGEVVGLLGHNGAGKSTIMKMLTGYLEPTAGRITLDGLHIGRDTAAIQSRIGYLPENCPVWPEMTVIDFLSYQAALHRVPKAQRDAAIARAIRRTDLAEKATSPIHTLSRGYRQRVGVAQAILHDPAIVILDEPTNGLDPTQIHQMRALIRELAQSATVILSTHILQEVQAVCERVLIMRAGQLVVDKRLEALRDSDRIRLVTGADARTVLEQVVPEAQLDRAADAGEGRYEYHFRMAPSRLPEITGRLVAAHIPVYALTPEQRDLERVFAEVNGEVQP